MSTLAGGEINLDRLIVCYQEHSSRNGKLIPTIPDDLTEAERAHLTLALEQAEEKAQKRTSPLCSPVCPRDLYEGGN